MAGADIVVAGAGMGGLVAAAEARRLGAGVELLEKGDRPGGAMSLSSGVLWRHRSFEAFRAECPNGDPALQRLVFDRLDDDIAWLRDLGAPVTGDSTGNPRTTGARFDPAGLTDALVGAAGPIRLGAPLHALPDRPTILATGGFAAGTALVREHITDQAERLMLRTTPWSTGDGMRLGTAAGAALTAGLDEFYGRAMPAPPARISAGQFVELVQLYARHAVVTNLAGDRYTPRTWSEVDVVQWMARQSRARALYSVPVAALEIRVGERTIGAMIERARAAGARVERTDGTVTVDVVASITTTLGGLEVDERALAAPGVFACGNDVGSIATGGYASGLAAALVLGRIAARSALEAAG